MKPPGEYEDALEKGTIGSALRVARHPRRKFGRIRLQLRYNSELGTKPVSRIWDSLKDVETRENASVSGERVGSERRPLRDRRCAPRTWAYSPVLVYGHTSENEPFHEGTEALQVNPSGGLIMLDSAVVHGQTLILINKANEKEQKCRVVCERSGYLNRVVVAVGFPEPVPDFWT